VVVEKLDGGAARVVAMLGWVARLRQEGGTSGRVCCCLLTLSIETGRAAGGRAGLEMQLCSCLLGSLSWGRDKQC
jgi:hypothetical protein